MKVLRSVNDKTNKYIHKDGSETAIKRKDSGRYIVSDSEVCELSFTNRNKYSIVASCSSGCSMQCSFCHLHKSNTCKFLTCDEIVENVKLAVEVEAIENPDIANRYVKLCWMGMGEPLLNSQTICDATKILIPWIIENKYAKGIDGVDVSTMYPKTAQYINWSNSFSNIVKYLNEYKTQYDINSEKKDSLFRLFLSLHSATQETRTKMIPFSKDIESSMKDMATFAQQTGSDIVIHTMFIHGVNDDNQSIKNLKEMMLRPEYSNFELRVLRYNPLDTFMQESSLFDKIVQELQKDIVKFKVQYSAGSDINAACGQFLVA